MIGAFREVWMDSEIGVVLLIGNGPSSKEGKWTFCAGGDQSVRGHGGYVGSDGVARLNELWNCSEL